LVSSGKSAMPEGLEKDLRPQDLADLFAYIRAAAPAPRRQARLGPPSVHMRGDLDHLSRLKPRE
jgi:hypothetical protein